MNSMTGFGKAERKSADGAIVVEVSTVNNRFLEFSLRAPRQFSGLEARVREQIQSALSRGKVNVHINYDRRHSEYGEYHFNDVAADAYLKQIKAYQKKRKLSGEVSISDLLSLPEVSRAPQDDLSDNQIWKVLKPALVDALAELSKMRKREGGKLAADMRTRLKRIGTELKKIEKLAKSTVSERRDKLRERVAELLNGSEMNKQRLEEEISLLAERTDISEEITRMFAHLKHFDADLKKTDAVGRRLNFLLQEMNREVNTIGSKSANLNVSEKVISLKEEIEKIREQVQNVE